MKTQQGRVGRRGWKQVATRAALGLLLLLAPTGCMLHHIIPSGHRPAPQEFGMGPRRSTTGAYQALIETDQPLVRRKMQTVRLVLTDAEGRPVDGASLTVDGGMPAHGHGLPTQPRITRALGGGRYLVEGVKFNMGGWWVLTFQVHGVAGSDRVTFNLDL